MDSFNQIGFLDKDKEIKFFSSIGDEQISEEAISNINDDYTNYKNKVMEDLREHGVHRYIVEKNSDAPLIE